MKAVPMNAGRLATIKVAMIQYLYLGRVDYDEALRLQAEVAERGARAVSRTSCCCSSTRRCLRWAATPTAPTFSLQTNCWPAAALPSTRSTAAATLPTMGRGNWLGYPIFDLRSLRNPSGGRLGPVDFVRMMEEALIRLCGVFGVRAGRICGLTGVWCGLRAAALWTRAATTTSKEGRTRKEDRRHRHSCLARHHLARLRLQRNYRSARLSSSSFLAAFTDHAGHEPGERGPGR
jgi:hypothetical protein